LIVVATTNVTPLVQIVINENGNVQCGIQLDCPSPLPFPLLDFFSCCGRKLFPFVSSMFAKFSHEISNVYQCGK